MMNIVLNDALAAVGQANFDEVLPLEKDIFWPTDIVSFDTPGREQRNQLAAQPLRTWNLNYGLMNEAVRNELWEIFNRARGSYDTFLYSDRDDYECSFAECTIVATAGQTLMQLVKNYYVGETETWSEEKTSIVPGGTFAPVVKLDGIIKVEGVKFTLDDATGIINWAAGTSPEGALSAGEVVTANYQFYFKVRFAEDVLKDLRNIREFWDYSGTFIVEVLP